MKISIEEKNLLGKELEEKIKEQLQRENDIKRLEKEVQDLNREIKELENKIQHFKDEEFELLRKTSEINNNISLLNKEILNKEELGANGENTLKTIEGNISINLATILGLNKNIEETRKIREEIKNSILENKKKLSSLSSSATRKESLIREVSRNISILEGKLTTLKDLEKSYEGYQLSVKRLMERIENGQVSYGKGTKVLGEIFTVNKDYETAIEIALGGSISNIITKDENVAKLLIDYLKKNSLGRATFLPLNIIKGNRLMVSENIKNVPGFLGLASDLIKFDSKFSEIMDYSLGKTIIARDMESALKISKLGNYKLKIVTLDGEVISPGGALTGGSIYKKNNSSILGRRRELQELEENISKSKERYSLEQESLNKIKEEIKVIDEENLNKSDEVHEKTIDITRFESEIKALENEGLKLKNSFEVSKKELSLNKETLNRLREEIKIKEELLDKLKENNSSNKNESQSLQTLLIEKKENFDKIKDEVIQIKINKATLDEVVYGKESEIKRKEKEEKEKEEKILKLEAENTEKEKNINYLKNQLNLTLAEAVEIALDIENLSKVKDDIFKLKAKITALGTVNLAAIVEYEEVCEKYEFMSAQEEDLNKAKDELMTVINEMTSKMQELFRENFKILNKNFNETFKDLFKGGNAELILGEGDELTANIEINVQPPGKKLQNINLMSGGEKVLSAIALLFAILKMKPTPFCILDEIEAALDDANVYRYAEFLKEFSENIQFIVITHRKGTMEASDVMYGVTMEEKGVSKVVSVDLSKDN